VVRDGRVRSVRQQAPERLHVPAPHAEQDQTIARFAAPDVRIGAGVEQQARRADVPLINGPVERRYVARRDHVRIGAVGQQYPHRLHIAHHDTPHQGRQPIRARLVDRAPSLDDRPQDVWMAGNRRNMDDRRSAIRLPLGQRRSSLKQQVKRGQVSQADRRHERSMIECVERHAVADHPAHRLDIAASHCALKARVQIRLPRVT
jgi:hypothetical protein